ncbi:MAG: hypothetical protein M1118_06800 [Chloroflexi bacterium]|nr:hypothetical protein [Chloroflexota bacterium]
MVAGQHGLPHDQTGGRLLGPERLGFHLTRYSEEDVCQRLGCDPAAARRLLLFHTPDPYEWLHSVRVIARTLAVPADRLSALLREAMSEE